MKMCLYCHKEPAIRKYCRGCAPEAYKTRRSVCDGCSGWFRGGLDARLCRNCKQKGRSKA